MISNLQQKLHFLYLVQCLHRKSPQQDYFLFSYKFDCTNNFYKGKTTWDDDGFVVNTKWSTYERGSAMDMYAKQACNQRKKSWINYK